MKKLIAMAATALILSVSAKTFAQEHQQETTAAQDIKNAGKKVGHKTAEIASKGNSKLVDKTYADKVGPKGQTIFIDKHARYYYVDGKGRHHFVAESELVDKH